MPSPVRPPLAAVVLLTILAPSRARGQDRPAPTLPPIPAVDGPLDVRVVYPPARAQVTASDSTFVFGSTGSGHASLTINGRPVSVAPNGAFLAFLPLPADTLTVLRLVAWRGADSVVLDHPIRLPARFVPPPAGAWIDAGSIQPRGRLWVQAGEEVRLGARAAPGAAVAVRLADGRLIPLAPDPAAMRASGPFATRPGEPAAPDAGQYAGAFTAVPIGEPLPLLLAPGAGADTGAGLAELVAVVGSDTARARLPLRVTVLDGAGPVVELREGQSRAGSGDAVGAPRPGGPYHWFLPNGTPAQLAGRSGDLLRVRLSRTSSAWVAFDEIAAAVPPNTPAPRARVALVRLRPGPASVTARIILSGRVPFRVDEEERALTLRLYSSQSDLDWLQYGTTDPLVRLMRWDQPADDEVTVRFELSRSVTGYRARWDGTDLLLEIRRPRAVTRSRPLRGLVVAVDPGHPPAGATGPTGLREAEANLAVALELQALLERAGARVVLTRTTDAPLGLYERVRIAEQADADVLVSVHNNAFPDGVNPFVNHGTSTYYFHPRAARLAYLVQQGLLREMGLPDIGYGRGDLALARPTWMPAVLTEGAFLMIPEQEHALRTPAFQRRYAQGILSGLEAWQRELAEER